MRELIGRIPTKDSNVTKEVYLSELIRCRNCERTVPVGVEVVTVKGAGTTTTRRPREPSNTPTPFESGVTTYYRGTPLAAAKLISNTPEVKHLGPPPPGPGQAEKYSLWYTELEPKIWIGEDRRPCCLYPVIWTLNIERMFEEAPSLPIQNAAPVAEAEVKPRRRKAMEKAPRGIVVGTVRLSTPAIGGKQVAPSRSLQRVLDGRAFARSSTKKRSLLVVCHRSDQ